MGQIDVLSCYIICQRRLNYMHISLAHHRQLFKIINTLAKPNLPLLEDPSLVLTSFKLSGSGSFLAKC